MDELNQKFSDYHVYFESIRRRVFSLAVVFVIFFILGFLETGRILEFILGLFKLQDAIVVTTSPFQFLDLATKIGVYTGVIFCLPLFIYHIYAFLKDGLNKNEKKMFFILLPISFMLFVIGFSYCFGILYFYLSSVSSINVAFGIKNIWDINVFLSQVFFSCTFFGLVFQFPILLTFLIRVGLVDVNFLRKNRLYAICGIFIFVGFLPPPDIFSTFIQAFPLVIIYQLTIWVNSHIYTQKKIDLLETFETKEGIIEEVT
jgi:sec-independent protein translocase protein TatC